MRAEWTGLHHLFGAARIVGGTVGQPEQELGHVEGGLAEVDVPVADRHLRRVNPLLKHTC